MPPYETSLLSLVESTILGFRKTIGRGERNRLSNIGRFWKNRERYLERVRGAQGSSLRVRVDETIGFKSTCAEFPTQSHD